MSEPSPAASRRGTLLVGGVAAAVLVVIAIVILRSSGPEDSVESRTASSPGTRLANSSRLVDEAVNSFHDHHAQAWPASVWTEDSELKLTGPGASEAYSPGVGKHVRVAWYRSKGDRFAYCLTERLRHLVVVTTSTEVHKRESAGACPAPSLQPDLDPQS